jgi:hypothetical protein
LVVSSSKSGVFMIFWGKSGVLSEFTIKLGLVDGGTLGARLELQGTTAKACKTIVENQIAESSKTTRDQVQ